MQQLHLGITTEIFEREMTALRGHAAERGKVAARWLVDLLAAVFVDAMRMLYVGASATARSANVQRYSEFQRMAEHHLTDLDRQMGRYAAELDAQILAALRVIEPRLRWTVNQLTPDPCQPGSALRYFRQMPETAQSLADLCVAASIDSYPGTRALIDGIAKALWSPVDRAAGWVDYDRLFILRLQIQTLLLEETQSAKRLPLTTIADDAGQSFAISYFLIDEWLLDRALG